MPDRRPDARARPGLTVPLRTGDTGYLMQTTLDARGTVIIID